MTNIPFSFTLIFGVNLIVLANGRNEPLHSPFYAPLQSPTLKFVGSPSQEIQTIIVYKHHHLGKEVIMAIALSLAAFALIVVSVVITCFLWRHNQYNANCKKNKSLDSTSKGITLAPILAKFNSFKMVGRKFSLAMVEYHMVESATDNFSQSNLLGSGRTGYMYKACFVGGVQAAVKKLNGSKQGSEKEFENEIDVLGKVQHPNIINLLGYSVYGDMRFLVYELMENGSLETQLHGPSQGSKLSWHVRMKIALDAARGLEHLHEHCNLIHRNLKSSNILLDSKFNAKISDFGLSVIGGSPNKSNIKLSDTLGYVAPEYLLDGKFTEKSDVYAFGVILLELLMGRKPVEKLAPSQCQTIVTWAMPQLTDRSKLPSIIDPAIRNTMDLKHLYQVAAVAVLCVQPEPSYRPLITDVLHSFIPLVPTELGGMLRVSN